MIITKAPLRISFVGGGSDLESHYLTYGGSVISTTINKYVYISSHRFFNEFQVLLKYNKIECVDDINKIQHPIFREVLKKFKYHEALEISSNADVPAGTGMGSSSTFTVALIHNICIRNGISITKHELAQLACDIEINILKEPIGKQDQYATVFGGLNIINFNKDSTVTVDPLNIKNTNLKLLQNHLALYYTGIQRDARSILTEQTKNTPANTSVINNMVACVDMFKNALLQGNMHECGNILNINWELKKQLTNNISNGNIDNIYNIGLSCGAYGAKLLGAGGGGFMLFIIPPQYKQRLHDEMCKLNLRNIAFELESNGSQLIYMGA